MKLSIITTILLLSSLVESNIDWTSACPHVKNQGQCGSSYAFAAVGALECAIARRTGRQMLLSEQEVIDCSRPYAYDDQCKFNQNNIGATINGYVDIPSGDEKALQNAIATIGPISVMVDASNISFQLYAGGIYDESNCSSDLLDHAMTVVGMGTDENGKDYYLVKNSFGAGWGENGHIRMSANNNNQCGITTKASYPTV